MKKRGIFLVVILMGIVLGACTGSSTKELEGTHWVLVEINQSPIIVGTAPTLHFEDEQVSGYTGCNSFSGGFQVDDDVISFSGLFWTEIGCMEPAGVMEQERAYMELLGLAERFELGNEALKIFTGSEGSLTFEKPEDASNASSQPSPVPPTATVEAPAAPETPAFEPPAGFAEYRAESIGVSIYIPEDWVEHTVVEGEYVILLSYPKDKYVGGEGLEPGDTKCDLSLRPEGESRTTLIDQWKSSEMTTILSEEEIALGSGEPAIRVELDSLGRSNVVITEIGGRVITLGCFGDFSDFDEIAATIAGIE